MRLPAALFLSAVLSSAPLAAQPALTGPEILVNPGLSTFSFEATAAVTDATGHLMVVWSESRARLFDAAGAPLGPGFTLPTVPKGSSDVTLAPDVPDGFLLTWIAVAGNTGRIFARRLDPFGRPRGGAIDLRGPFNANRYWNSPLRLGALPDRSFVAVWSEGDEPSTLFEDVFVRRFDAAGRPLGPVTPLPREDGENQSRISPSLAVLENGEMVVAWISVEEPAYTLWVRRFDRQGAPLSAPLRILTTSTDLSVPEIVFGSDGGFLVALDDLTAVRLRAFASDGTPRAEHQMEKPSWLQMTAEPGGTFLVTWRPEPGACGLSGLHLQADGTPFAPAACLINASPLRQVDAFRATATGHGSFALFWSQMGRTGETGYLWRLFLQRLATAGPGTLQLEKARSAVVENAGAPLELRVLRRDGTAGPVSVDYRITGAAAGSGTITFPDGDSTPRILSIPVVDDDLPGNDRIVRVTLLRPTGGAGLGLPRRAFVEVRDDDAPSPLLARPGPVIEISDGSLDVAQWDPGVAASPAGEIQVVWAHDYDARYSDYFYIALMGQHFDATGNPGLAFDHQRPSDPGQVRLAMHPKGNFTLFWQEWRSSDRRFFSLAQRFDAHGAAAGPIVSPGFLLDAVAPLPGGRFVAVGRDQDEAGEGLFVQILSQEGVAHRRPVLVSRALLMPGSLPTVAAQRTGRFVVAWSVPPTGAGPAGVFARLYNASGVPLGPAFRVSEWDGYDHAISVDMDGHGNFVVAWQRNRDGGTGVYARIFDTAGSPRSHEIPVPSETTEPASTPSVAMTGDGRFAVLWASLSVGLKGQLFTGTGARLGSEALIDPWGGISSIDWSDQGFFVTAFLQGPNVSARRLPL